MVSSPPARQRDFSPQGDAKRRGLTLIELLVVMVILVILTTVAVQATSSVVDQGRYDATQRTLQSIQDAILGPAGQRAPDGSVLISGFVADLGRLPQPVYVAGTLVGDPLRELWDASAIPAAAAYGAQPPITIANYAISPSGTLSYSGATTTVTMTMPCGWRGPYLQLSTGSGGQLLDGWGNAFDSIYQTTAAPYSQTTPPPPGDQVNIVRSRGADDAADPFPLPAGFPAYNIDQYVPTQLNVPPIVSTTTPLVSFSNNLSASLTVAIRTLTSTSSGSILSPPTPVGSSDAVEIVLLQPLLQPSGAVLEANYAVNPALSGTSPVYFWVSSTASPATTSWDAIALPATTPGPRAVQAFQFDSSSGTVSKRSPLTFLMVPPGGLSAAVTLILQ